MNAADEHGYTCLHAAASYGHAELVHFLVARGGNVARLDPDGDTPLHVCEEVEVAQVLVGYGADPQARNAEGKRPHDVALEDGHVALANYLRGLCGLGPATEADMEAAMAGALGEEAEAQHVGLQDLQDLVAAQTQEENEHHDAGNYGGAGNDMEEDKAE